MVINAKNFAGLDIQGITKNKLVSPKTLPPVQADPEDIRLSPDHEIKFTYKTAFKVAGMVAGFGALNSLLGFSELEQLVALRPFTRLPAAILTGAVSFYLGNHVKHTLRETPAEKAYVRKERTYETFKGAAYAAFFLAWQDIFAGISENYLAPFLSSAVNFAPVRGLLFHCFLGLTFSPLYSLLDSVGSKLLNLHGKKYEHYWSVFKENLQGSYKFYYFWLPYKGNTLWQKTKDFLFKHGFFYSVLSFTLCPPVILPTVVCGISTLFSYFHAQHKENGKK